MNKLKMWYKDYNDKRIQKRIHDRICNAKTAAEVQKIINPEVADADVKYLEVLNTRW